jgi:DNA-binding transcriptional LysR family regulator
MEHVRTGRFAHAPAQHDRVIARKESCMPHRRNIDIDLLRSFVTIIEVKSFTRAAERLLRTQSAISLQMKRLEEQLDCRLFERGGRGVEPTEAGTLLLSYARRILAANDELVGRMAEPLVEGEVRIGAPEAFAAEHLAPVLARFARAFPKVHMVVRTGASSDLAAAQEKGELDLRVDTVVGERPNAGEELNREALVWCVAEGAEPEARPGSADQPLRLVATTGACPMRSAAEQALSTAGRPYKLVFEGTSRGSVVSAIGAGLGVGVLPRGSIASGMHRLSDAEGLPNLPDATTMLVVRPGIGLVGERLRGFLLNVFGHRH